MAAPKVSNAFGDDDEDGDGEVKKPQTVEAYLTEIDKVRVWGACV